MSATPHIWERTRSMREGHTPVHGRQSEVSCLVEEYYSAASTGRWWWAGYYARLLATDDRVSPAGQRYWERQDAIAERNYHLYGGR